MFRRKTPGATEEVPVPLALTGSEVALLLIIAARTSPDETLDEGIKALIHKARSVTTVTTGGGTTKYVTPFLDISLIGGL